LSIGLQFKRSATLIGDIGFKAPWRLAAQAWNKHTKVPMYSYHFNAIPNGTPDYYGVTHWQEVPFIFHNVHGYGFPNIDPPYFGPDPFANRSQSYVDLATLMSRMWSTFIHDGNPNFPCRTPGLTFHIYDMSFAYCAQKMHLSGHHTLKRI